MFKITEETLEQEVANFLQKELIKKGLKCDSVTQATPISIRKRKGEQFDILLNIGFGARIHCGVDITSVDHHIISM